MFNISLKSLDAFQIFPTLNIFVPRERRVFYNETGQNLGIVGKYCVYKGYRAVYSVF